MSDLKRLVVTEYPGKGWLLNIDKYNDETDVEIPEELALYILKLQKQERDFVAFFGGDPDESFDNLVKSLRPKQL